jgi:hypothetical protein
LIDSRSGTFRHPSERDFRSDCRSEEDSRTSELVGILNEVSDTGYRAPVHRRGAELNEQQDIPECGHQGPYRAKMRRGKPIIADVGKEGRKSP